MEQENYAEPEQLHTPPSDAETDLYASPTAHSPHNDGEVDITNLDELATDKDVEVAAESDGHLGDTSCVPAIRQRAESNASGMYNGFEDTPPRQRLGTNTSGAYDGFESDDVALPVPRSRQGSGVSAQLLQCFSTLEEESPLEISEIVPDSGGHANNLETIPANTTVDYTTPTRLQTRRKPRDSRYENVTPKAAESSPSPTRKGYVNVPNPQQLDRTWPKAYACPMSSCSAALSFRACDALCACA
eukprot:m.206127 g.206127  ORF g.206127 m.206127 type:complete len:245 (+) comp18890_c0_seq6:1459-2193(+)